MLRRTLIPALLTTWLLSGASAEGAVRLFARVPAPGTPEGLAVSPDGETIYTSTYQPIQGGAQGPSKIFAYSRSGQLERTYTLTGQRLDGTQGAGGMAFDAEGRLYVVAVQPDRVVTIDPSTGAQHDYATFDSVPQCSTPAERPAYPCTASATTGPPLTPAIVFAPDGSLYVSDTQQALIWKVPAGGGPGQVWFTDQRFTSSFGINKLVLTPDAKHLLFTETTHEDPTTGIPASGAVWQLDVGPDGRAGALSRIWQSPPGILPDGIALGTSGNLWVSTLGARSGVLQLSPSGEQLKELPANELANQQQQVPFDDPSSVAFLGESLLVANSSFIANNPDHWALLAADVGDRGVAAFAPRVSHPGSTPRSNHPRARHKARTRRCRHRRRGHRRTRCKATQRAR